MTMVYANIISLPLFLFPQNTLGLGPLHLIIRSISSHFVHEFKPFSKLTHFPSLRRYCLSGSVLEDWGSVCH